MNTIIGQLTSGTTAPSPRIECYPATEGATGIGIIILPGGGYGGLAEHEGKGYAEHFCAVGISCFVVSYRLGSEGFRHPAMLEDALAAIRTVREHASELNISPHKLGIMGSSAGGHLAAHAMVAWSQYESDIALRPDFGILCYPVITSHGPYAHEGSMLNLAGKEASTDLLNELSCERSVRADTPPCFIWHTGEDSGVPCENSIFMALALREHNVPFELHVYAKGNHGLGLNAPFAWEADCLRWLKETLLESGS